MKAYLSKVTLIKLPYTLDLCTSQEVITPF